MNYKSEYGGNNLEMSKFSSDQMICTSWGCGAFSCGFTAGLVMWQDVVACGGRRVLSDDGSWRNHVLAGVCVCVCEGGWVDGGGGCKGRLVGGERVELFTQQTGLPSPSSWPASHPPTVGDMDPGGAVNSSDMEQSARAATSCWYSGSCSLYYHLSFVWVCHSSSH